MSGFDREVLYAEGIDLTNQPGNISNQLGTDGFVYFGNSSGRPQAGLPDSADGSITFTGGPGTLDAVVDTSNLPTVATTFSTDSGDAAPSGNVLNVLGGPGVNVTGSGNTLTINSVSYTDEGSSTTVSADSGSFSTAAITLTLPSSPSQGERCEFIASTADQLVVQASGTQVIHINGSDSSAGGTATNSGKGDALTLIYQSSSDDWFALNNIGVWSLA